VAIRGVDVPMVVRRVGGGGKEGKRERDERKRRRRRRRRRRGIDLLAQRTFWVLILGEWQGGEGC
jgi:hypothetical protein